MRKAFLIGCMMLMFVQLFASGTTPIRAGVARVKITPALPMWLTGYAGRNSPAKEILHDIWAKALALEDGDGHRVVFVTIDVLGLSYDIVEQVMHQCDSSYGLKRSQLILNSSHTHSGPMVWPCLDIIYDLNADDQKIVSNYADTLTAKIVVVIGQALQKLSPAHLSSGHGTAEFAINRRNDLHPGGPTDHDVMVVKVADEKDKIQAVLFGYACHNTTLVENNFLINGDYAGFAQIAIEKAYPGAQAMFMQGCAGDQNPAPRGTVQLAAEHGQQLADAVQTVISSKMKEVRSPIMTSYATADLPFVQFDPSKYRAEILSADVYLQRRARLMLDGYNRGWVTDHLHYPVQAVRFNNDLTILALSGEVVVDYSLRAKKEFSKENLFVAAYSNEVMCYIPSLRVLKEGGYEGGDNMIYYGFPGPFRENVEEKVFSVIRQVMKNTGAGSNSKSH